MNVETDRKRIARTEKRIICAETELKRSVIIKPWQKLDRGIRRKAACKEELRDNGRR